MAASIVDLPALGKPMILTSAISFSSSLILRWLTRQTQLGIFGARNTGVAKRAAAPSSLYRLALASNSARDAEVGQHTAGFSSYTTW